MAGADRNVSGGHVGKCQGYPCLPSCDGGLQSGLPENANGNVEQKVRLGPGFILDGLRWSLAWTFKVLVAVSYLLCACRLLENG